MSVSSTGSVVPEGAVVEAAAEVVEAAATVVVVGAAFVVIATIVGAVTAHGFSLVHMVVSESAKSFETKSVTPEEISAALPAKIAVT